MESTRVVLVTNVGTGFGRAVALAYGRSGYHVVCADSDVDLAAKTAAEVEELGGQAIPIQTDTTTQMDVLSAYHKVMEIFGTIGGVVHLAAQVSTTPFEDLAEGEFFELMAEDVRSSYLILKAASRLLGNGWVVIVAPPVEGSVQMRAVQGALRELVEGFRQRFAYPRVNLVTPSRASSDPRHDQALVRAVRFLGSQESAGVSGQSVAVELPQPPRIAENLLPEVRAALDTSVRQSDEERWPGWEEATEPDGLAVDDGGLDDSEPADLDSDELASEDLGLDATALQSAPGLRRPASAVTLDELDDEGAGLEDDLEDGALDYFDDWAADLGLPDGPALRHLVAEDGATTLSGLESANALYGDLRSLQGAVHDDLLEDDDLGEPWPLVRRRP